MEEEDKKTERDLEILKNYKKKEAKSIKKIFKFNWNEKTGLKKILMIIFYSVLLYLINIIYWFIK